MPRPRINSGDAVVASEKPGPCFVGREGLLRKLGALYRHGHHVVLTGPVGSGKTSVLDTLARQYPFLVAPRSVSMGDLLQALEPATRLAPDDTLTRAERVHRLAEKLGEHGLPLLLDNVQRVPPRVAHFIRYLLPHQPVWIVARSTLAADIGHVWPYLFHFTPLAIPPFSAEETEAFLRTVDFSGDRAPLVKAARRLHRISAGHPATLAALVAELRIRTYDLQTAEGLRLLALHARITRVETQLVAPSPDLDQ